jgi:hypothetical protein
VALAVLAFRGKAALEDALPHDSWNVPYCWECLEHVKRKDEDEMHDDCVNVKAAVAYHGFHGSVHTFSFYNWRYANRFIDLNRDKCVM